MKLTVIVALLLIELVQPQAINGRERPETELIVRVERGWFSRQVDAYITVTIGSTSHTTRTVRGNRWNQLFTFINPTSSYMLVRVWNKPRGGYKLMGECLNQVVAGVVNHSVRCNIPDGFVNIYYTY